MTRGDNLQSIARKVRALLARTQAAVDFLHAEAALCIWEGMLELRDTGKTPSMDKQWEASGTTHMRQLAMELATPCEAAWRELTPEQRDAQMFDWEFVPKWIIEHFEGEARP